MPRIMLVAGLAAALVFWILWRGKKTAKERRSFALKSLGFGAAGLLIFMVFTGRMHWLGIALAAIIPVIRPILFFALRNVPLLAQLYKQFAPAAKPQNQSRVSARFLDMSLDHETGNLNGRVTEGPFRDCELAALDEVELSELLDYCRLHDADSARLLESYLEQRFGADTQDSSAHSDSQSQDAPSTGGPMNREEALAVLGLEDSPTRDDIIAAHRQLMQKLHPDRGGNDYLASKLNGARDLLINELS